MEPKGIKETWMDLLPILFIIIGICGLLVHVLHFPIGKWAAILVPFLGSAVRILDWLTRTTQSASAHLWLIVLYILLDLAMIGAGFFWKKFGRLALRIGMGIYAVSLFWLLRDAVLLGMIQQPIFFRYLLPALFQGGLILLMFLALKAPGKGAQA